MWIRRRKPQPLGRVLRPPPLLTVSGLHDVRMSKRCGDEPSAVTLRRAAHEEPPACAAGFAHAGFGRDWFQEAKQCWAGASDAPEGTHMIQIMGLT